MRIPRTVLALALLATAALPLAAALHYHTSCTSAAGATGDAATSPGAAVTVGLDWFAPPAVTVAAGESVTWTWDATSPYCHSVTAASFGTQEVTGTANGRLVPAGAAPSVANLAPNPTNPPGAALSYTHVFDTPGTYTYLCQEHALIGMAGVVRVV